MARQHRVKKLQTEVLAYANASFSIASLCIFNYDAINHASLHFWYVQIEFSAGVTLHV